MALRWMLVLMLAVALAGCSSMRRGGSKPAAAQPEASTAKMPEYAAPPVASRSSTYMQGPGSYASGNVPPMESGRRINEQDCTQAIDLGAGNLRCR